MSMYVEDMNCTERCRSFQHGQEICAISTKGTDQEVLSLWKSTCMKFHKIKDEFGRSAVHIAASTGRPKVVEWLVKREGADINAKDFLSGYTPLHRSIYFGHLDVARTLIRLDASLSSQDQEGYFPLDLCQLDSPLKIREEELHRSPNEVYVWGSNENYNLGTGTEQPRFVPEILDRSKKLPWGYLASCFTQIAMERYHTLFLHWSYDVYSCGYGVGGRLGLGNEFAALAPTKIDVGSDSGCVKVAVGPDHSLFLMSSGEVKSCGLNENSVLGHNHAMKKVFAPKHVDVSSTIIDIAASRFHSVFMSPDNIYTCGINIGQMCKPDVIEKVVKPVKIIFPFDLEPKSQRQGHGQKGKFTGVACNECAIAVAHNGGNIYILKNYDCITLNTRHVDIQKINLVGGLANWSRDKVSHGEGDSSLQSKTVLTMFVLIKSGRLLIWREGSEQPAPTPKINAKNSQVAQFNLAVFNAGRALSVRDFSASCTSVILITDNGEAYKALWNVGASPTCFPNMNSPASKPSGSKSVNQWSYVVQNSARHHAGKDPFSNMMLEHLKLKRIPNIYNGIGAFCDPRGNNFAITQKHQKADQVVLPVGMASEINEDFGVLLMETSVEDNIHDVIFQVRSNLYPAHRFVIASSCKVLFELLKKDDCNQSQAANDNDSPRVVLNDVEPRVFEQILQYLYTNNCDILISGKFSCKPDDPDWVELCKLYARKLGLHDLQKRLKVVVMEGGVNHGGNSKCSDVKFSLKAHQDLCDIDLISDDDMHTQVHLCVLVARLEYFKSMMLSNYWLEGSRSHCQKQLKFPSSKAVMDIFMQMMYEGSFTYNNTGTKKDLEVLSQALVASDLLLSQQYRSQIECSLAECISLKSVSEIIHLAEICNAPQLKDSCIEFISWNIAPLLENRCLESIPDGIMDEISRHYRSRFARIEYRKITDVTAPEKGAYEAAEERFKDYFLQLDTVVDAEYVTPLKSQSNKGKTKLQNRNRTISGSSAHEAEGNNNSFCFDDDDYENSEFDLTPLGPSYPEKFTVVKKHVKSSPRSPPYHGKESSPTPTTTTKITIPLPSRTLKFLPTVEETNSSPPTFTALPSPLTKKTHKATPIAALKASDFPSFESVYVNSKSTSIKGVDSHIVSASATNDIGKSGSKPQSQLSSPSTSTKACEGNGNGGSGAVSSVKTGGVSRRKTKWLSLNDTAVASKANVSNSPAVPESNSRDPKNPWQKTTNLPLKTPEEQTQDGVMCFDDIVQHEERKKKNLRKALDKPLRATQIEDQAVSELLKRYTSEDVIEGYELLQVELVSTSDDYAIPVWRKILENPLTE